MYSSPRRFANCSYFRQLGFSLGRPVLVLQNPAQPQPKRRSERRGGHERRGRMLISDEVGVSAPPAASTARMAQELLGSQVGHVTNRWDMQSAVLLLNTIVCIDARGATALGGPSGVHL